jgi:hypothetical protein
MTARTWRLCRFPGGCDRVYHGEVEGEGDRAQAAYPLEYSSLLPAQTLSDVGMLLVRIWRRSVRCRVRQIYYITSVCSTCVSCDKPPFGNLSEYQILEGFQCHNRNRCTIVLLRLHHFTLLVDQTTIDQVT